MIKYVSTRGGIGPVSFDEAVLNGFADDGGLFVPQSIPRISSKELMAWAELSYTELAAAVLPRFIPEDIIPLSDLKTLIDTSFERFDHPEIMPLIPLGNDTNLMIMELFHGPTLSFKDIAMGFLINTMDYLLEKRGGHLNLVLATTGDTGPAAAHAAAGKATIDCWPLFPLGMITVEQQRQMTTLTAGNIHSVGVENCPDGGDDLDLVVEKLFSDHDLVRQLHLSSVNSINWCRVMVQSVHYIYAYLKGCGTIGKPVVVSVPSGAFGNLFAGYLARAMGVPIHTFVCANNSNATLHRAFSTGVFQKQDLIRTVSSAIDIVVPYNFWRFLYFQSGCDGQQLSRWMDRFRQDGRFRLDEGTAARIREGYLSCSVSDTSTLECIKDTWQSQGYLLDPHGAVAVDAVRQLRGQLPEDAGRICLATAHPAKFPKVIQAALGSGIDLPDPAYHRSLADAAGRPERMQTCSKDDLETLLIESMRSSISRRK